MAGNEEGKGAADGKRRRRSAGGKDEDTEDPKGKRAKKAVLRGGAAARGNGAARGAGEGGRGGLCAAGCRARDYKCNLYAC